MMTILFIGANSNIGRSLVEKLKENFTVITAGRTNCDIQLDLQHPESIDFGHFQFDIVIHAAAHFGGKSIANAAESATINTVSTIVLFEKAKASGATRFIYLSSLFTGINGPSIWHNPYSISKKHAEEWLLYLAQTHTMDLLILRPTMIYGDDLSFAKHQAMPYFFIDQAHQGIDIQLRGDGSANRNYLHIEDLVDIIDRCVDRNITGVHPCMHPEQTTIRQLAEIAALLPDSSVQVHLDKNQTNPESLDLTPEFLLYKNIDKTEFIPLAVGMKRIYTTNYHNSNG
ncbi:MAG: hypothetical protein RLZZ262_674 [Bacteroidota bacterium]|jgi:nucleoside-diphosphate-sugar epimerase